jgi:hypothetical protein
MPIWNEGGKVGHQSRPTGWSDRIERGGDSLVCFKAVEYRHVPLVDREAEIYDVALSRPPVGSNGAPADAPDPDVLLQVIVRTEDVDADHQALDVLVHVADDLDPDWPSQFLHQIATDLAKET